MDNHTNKSLKHSGKIISEEMLFFCTKLLAILMFILSVILAIYLLIALFNPDYQLSQTKITRLQWAQFRFFIAGFFIVLIALICRKFRIFRILAKHETFINIILAIVTLASFIFISNNLLGIKYYRKPPEECTTVFIRDNKLGWKLRPNTEDHWKVGKYEINSKGLRSPHSDYEKPRNTKRILQLGDSATVGFGLPYEGTSAYILENLFKNNRHAKYSIEVINTACDGYSPWQEYEFLKAEGIKYKPDLVTVGFVLNDVTEQFKLTRFGGHDIGFQLSETKNYGDASRFSFYYMLVRMPIYLFLEREFLKIRFGKNIKEGAKKLEELRVKDLVFKHDDKTVQQAWKKTLSDLQKINDFCSDNKIELLLLIFPYTFQFDQPDSMAYPQLIMKDFCNRNAIHYIDFLKIFSDEMQRTGRKREYYFMDFDHPTIDGNILISSSIYHHINDNNLLQKE